MVRLAAGLAFLDVLGGAGVVQLAAVEAVRAEGVEALGTSTRSAPSPCSR